MIAICCKLGSSLFRQLSPLPGGHFLMGGKTHGGLYEHCRGCPVPCDRLPGGDSPGGVSNSADIADQVSADLVHVSDREREAKIETRRKWPK